MLTALTPASWGTTYVVTTELLPNGRPLLAATVRALPVGLVLIARRRQLPQGAWWWRAAILGTLNIGAFFALLFVAAYRLPGGVAATVGAVQPMLAAGIALVVLGEPLRRRTIVAGGLGFVGVALLVLRTNAHVDLVGLVAAGLGTASMAVGVVLSKRWGSPTDLVTFTGWQLTAGGLLLLPLLLGVEGMTTTFSPANVVGFAWLTVIATGFAYVNWFRGIQRLEIATVTSLTLIAPVVAAALGWLVLDQSLGLVQCVGVLVVLGAVVAQGRRPTVPRGPLTAPETDMVRR